MSKRKNLLGFVFVTFIVLLTASSASATTVMVGGKPLTFFGQFSQSIQYGWHDDFDTYYGINSAITTLIAEGDYKPAENVKLYTMLFLSGDSAYYLRSGDKWQERGFQRSASNNAWDTDWYQVLKELHVTWTPGDFLLRAGKQIISWGELLGVRVLDVINPSDGHRGPADIEFETSIVPVWMLRADYRLPYTSSLFSEINLQFFYDPRADKAIYTTGPNGTDWGGIWFPYIAVSPGVLVGSQNVNLHHSDGWTDPTIGFRIQGKIGDSLASLNFLYGRDYTALPQGAPTIAGAEPFGAVTVLHANSDTAFPIRRLIGGMFATELSSIPRLNGMSSPMFRLEWLYAFQSTFLSPTYTVETHDNQKLAASLEVGMPIRILNPSAVFEFSLQYSLNRIAGIEDGFENGVTGTDGPVNQLNHMTVFSVSTSYFAARLMPAIAWIQDWTTHSSMARVQASYTLRSDITIIGAILWFEGSEPTRGFEVFDHKDYASLKVQFKF